MVCRKVIINLRTCCCVIRILYTLRSTTADGHDVCVAVFDVGIADADSDFFNFWLAQDLPTLTFLTFVLSKDF